MSIRSPEELAALRRVGRVVAETIAEVRRRLVPGMTTAEVDAIAEEVFARHGARSAPRDTYGFPGCICLSVDDEAVHGIPGRRRLRDGDLLKLDVTAELDGFYADACVSVPVGRAGAPATHLVDTARRALAGAMRVARAGAPLNAIGAAVEQTVTARGQASLSGESGA